MRGAFLTRITACVAVLTVALSASLTPADALSEASGRVSSPTLVGGVFPAAKAKTGNLKVVISGLPKKAKAKVVVNGAGKLRKVTKSTTLKKLKVFVYDINVSDLKYGKYWYRGLRQSTTKAVVKGKTATVRIRYTKATTRTPPDPELPPAPAIRFNLSNSIAVGVARAGASRSSILSTAVQTPTTNLVAVKANNTVVPGISSGSLDISQARVGPDGSVYLAPTSPVVLDGDTQACGLIRVRNTDDRTGTCVDYAIEAVTAEQAIAYFGLDTGNPTIQFDAAGNVYYLASTKSSLMPNIYRDSSGTVTNLTPAGVYSDDFLVRPDGTVLVAGSTAGALWVRKITPQGGVSNLSTSTPAFIRAFSDGNIYLGASTRYLPETGALDPDDWIGPCLTTPSRPAHFTCDQIQDPVGGWESLQGVSIGMPMSLANLADGQAIGPLAVFDPNNLPGDQGWIMCYYPQPALFRTSIKVPNTAIAADDELVVAGATGSGEQRLIAFSGDDHTERTLLIGQVSISHLVYSASTRTVRFSGARVSDGAAMVGSVDLTSGTVAMTASTVTLLDLEGL